MWDEQDGDDVKLRGAFSSQVRAHACVEHSRSLPGFHDEPDCFLVGLQEVDKVERTEGYVTEPL